MLVSQYVNDSGKMKTLLKIIMKYCVEAICKKKLVWALARMFVQLGKYYRILPWKQKWRCYTLFLNFVFVHFVYACTYLYTPTEYGRTTMYTTPTSRIALRNNILSEVISKIFASIIYEYSLTVGVYEI